MHWVRCQRGRPVLIPDPPPPPPDPPKVFEPVSLQFEILGERVGTKGAEIFFLPFLRGYIFFFHPMCLYSKCSELENSKMFEKHRNFFDP